METGMAPETPFNVRVGPYRCYATTTLPLYAMRQLGRKLDASANDVLLAVCAGGLRTYLARRGALPEAPLLAGVPVSLRATGDRSFSNQVALLRATLATDVADPVARLRAIAGSTRAAKALQDETRALLPGDLHVPGLSYLLQGAVATSERLGWRRMLAPVCNVVISNVPGPRKAYYLMGAQMLTHHPVSIPADGNALNITVQSYGGRLDLGITGCLDAVPDVETLRNDLESSWLTLRDACLPEAVPMAA
jgi:WS/DGAT/MGAT family acyltransferase